MFSIAAPFREKGPRRTALLALLLLGALLRLTGLGVHSLWYDEGCTVYLARSEDVFAALRADRHPPLCFLLFKAWIAVFGEDDRVLRLLPALASTAALVLFAGLARAWAGPRAALVAVALVAVAPFHLWHAQEVRMYAFLELAVVAALAGTASYLERPGRGALLAVAVSVAFAFGTQYMGALVFPSILALGLLARVHGKITTRELARLAGAGAVGLAVWIPWIAKYLPEQMRTPWGFTAKVGLRDFVEFPARQVLTEMSALPPSLVPFGYALGAVLVAGLALAVVAAVKARGFGTTAILVGFAAPLLATAVESAFVPATFLPKYLMASAPCTALAIAVGFSDGLPRRLGTAAAVFACAGCLVVAEVHRARNLREDFRGACVEVEERWKPGDVVLVVTGTPEGFSEGAARHYLRDRDDVLASLREPAAFFAGTPAESLATDASIHVILRDTWYARAAMDALLAAHATRRSGERRFGVQNVELAAH